ncbi:MAG: FAD-dependent thymidylate synthase [Patescibacteria group bacterium]|nr:FAD-dependent thymidylate synthase [Patescibacteria group bacterium]
MKIFIYDEFGPENTAMMQALYSRSAESVEKHAEQVKSTGSGKFMEKFYVGYGHSSIADCGSTTVFIEQISILADKALQDWPLYSGQETSTRYVDMAKQAIIDPIGNKESKEILDKWMAFYVGSQEEVEKHLMKKYPKKPDEDEAVYGKAIKARCFDSLRGFLPAGITTQLSWHTNLRQAADKLATLRYHPLAEVREMEEKILSALQEKYPSSFSHKLYDEQEKYRKMVGENYTYFGEQKLAKDFSFTTTIDPKELSEYKTLIENRPEKTNLPYFLADLGLNNFEFYLDYGSFRDIQRHRNGVCRMPLLTTKFGFHQWYLEQLPDSVRSEAEKLIEEQKTAIAKLKASKEDLQYYIAIGFNVVCQVSYGLPATIYTVELRSGKMVHPTLRVIAHQMCDALTEKFPDLMLHADKSPSDWDIRRGLQDIKPKE